MIGSFTICGSSSAKVIELSTPISPGSRPKVGRFGTSTQKMLDANKYTTFNELVETVVRRDRSVKRLPDQLKALGELRNFLGHEYKRDQPVGVPGESSM